MDEQPGRWVDDPPLPILPKPDPPVRLSLGARLVHVHGVRTVAGVQRLTGYTPMLVVARARLGDGTWALLAGWQGHWQQHAHTTGKARWGWLRYTPPPPGQIDPVVGMPRPHPGSLSDGFAWHGQHKRSEFAKAMRGAVSELPHDMRAAAFRPLPDPETPDS